MDLIIGAGISGISYANFTKNAFQIIEKENEPGGYCRTIKRNGFVWDYSGHFFHFQNPDMEKYVCKNISPETLVHVDKHTQILYKGKYIDFPFQKNIHQLEKEEFVDCLYDLFAAKAEHYATFKEMVYANLGKSIAEKFLVPYNEKLYACDLDRLDVDAMGRFFPKACKEDIVLNFRNSDNSSYNARFTYPRGGAMEYVSSLLANIKGENVSLGEEVLHIDMDKKMVITTRREIAYDRLISSLPFPKLLDKCGISYPVDTFSCNKVLVFNLGFDSKGEDKTNNWIYVPDKDIIFYRVGYYDNILGTDRMSLYVEIGFPENQSLDKEGLYLERVLGDLRRLGIVTTQNLVDYEAVLMDPAYVHINKKGNDALASFKAQLAEKSVYSIGRYGSWTYCSIEDNMLEARRLAQELEEK